MNSESHLDYVLKFIKKQQLRYFGHIKRHQALEIVMLDGNVKKPKEQRKAKETLGEGYGGLGKYLLLIKN